jgi:C1A family cysteine protease
MNEYKFLYKFQNKDDRDYFYKAVTANDKANTVTTTINVPKKNTVTTRTVNANPTSFIISHLAPILDQGTIGGCVANAFTLSINTQTKNYLNISRLYLYANSRILDNTPLNQDDGTTPRSTCNAIKKYGAIPETKFPYNNVNSLVFPPLGLYQGAKYFKTFTYSFISQDALSLKSCLSNYKVPIVFGFLVFDSFLTTSVSSTGIVPMPNFKVDNCLGGHCMCIVGYDDVKQLFTCANSWGTKWGKNGLCYIPYKYLLDPNLAADFCFTQFVY